MMLHPAAAAAGAPPLSRVARNVPKLDIQPLEPCRSSRGIGRLLGFLRDFLYFLRPEGIGFSIQILVAIVSLQLFLLELPAFSLV